MMKRELAVVLVSGGMDSCVTASIANTDYELAFLHLNYNQRTCVKEQECFENLVKHFSIKRKLICRVEYFKDIGGSSLTDKSLSIPSSKPKNHEVPNTYVPFRNSHILSIAVSWAEVIGAGKIFIGAVWEDSSGYPDCRKEYYEAFNNLICVGTKDSTEIEVLTPLIDMKKKEIVKTGLSLDSPLNLTWSCYQNTDLACGECDSCKIRLRGFSDARVKDPIEYTKKVAKLYL